MIELSKKLRKDAKILWTNSNPTSSFASQTITLNSDDYDMYEIITSVSTTNDRYISTGKILKDKLCTLMWQTANQSSPYISIRIRSITNKTNTTISFGQAVSSTPTSGGIYNEQMIPIYVIGYKTGLFD